MIYHRDLTQGQLIGLIKRGEITFGGSEKYKIYGLLTCKPGKRALKKWRVFFRNEAEALAAGYRPCGSCQYRKYRAWRTEHPHDK